MKKRILSFALAVLMLMAVFPFTAIAAGNTYSDVPPSHWAYGVISKWSGDDYGVIEGVGNGSFSPSNEISLAELATILSKTFGYTERTTAEVAPAWADEYVEKAMAAGVIETADTIDASVSVTREQAVRYIAIAYQIKSVEGETSFVDDDDIDVKYKPYVKAFQALGYISGKPGNIFDPQGVYTRAEAMQLIDNTTSEIIDGSVSGQIYEKSAIIRTSGSTLKDTTVNGNLIIGQGVGDGEVTLDNVTVKGTLVVNGGGSNSIIIKGGSQIAYTVVNKQGGEPANLRVEEGSTVTAVEINAGCGARITGDVTEVSVSANATLEIAEGSFVQSVEIDGEKVTIYVSNGSTVQRITIEGDNITVQGEGHVEAIVVETGAGVEIGTTGTKITNNGEQSVKTKNGEIASGQTGSTTPPTTSSGGGSQSYTPSTSATVNTIAELQAALGNSAIVTINVPIILENYQANIAIPAGKTVVFAQNAGLRVNNLEVNGTVRGNGSNIVLYVGGTLSGTGLNADAANGFFGTGAGYTPHFWVWYTSNNGVATTGWWPTSVDVTDKATLAAALAVNTIIELHLIGTFNIDESFSIDYLHVYGDTTINISTTVEADMVCVWDCALTVNGTLTGINENAEIRLYGDSTLAIGGNNYKGPDKKFFDYGAIARIIRWQSSAWSAPILMNTNSGLDNAFVDAATLTSITYLASTYPELAGVHIYGGKQGEDDFAINENHTFSTTAFPVLIHGNQTFGFGADAVYRNPVVVGANVTLTIANGAEVRLVSDNGKLAITGTDAYSTIEVAGTLTDNNSTWATGTYKWSTNAWVKQ